MKKIYLVLIFPLFFFTACSTADILEKDPSVPDNNSINNLNDIDDPNEDGEIAINTSFMDLVIGRTWVGTAGVGPLDFPMYFTFGEDGNIKLYEKPLKVEDWELVQDFIVKKARIPSEKEEVDDIIDYSELLRKDILGEVLGDYCLTLYPDGGQVGEVSPFNLEMCLHGAVDSMTIDFLKHSFELSPQ